METTRLGLILFEEESQSTQPPAGRLNDVLEHVRTLTSKVQQIERMESELLEGIHKLKSERHEHSNLAKRQQQQSQLNATVEEVLMVLDRRVQILTSETSEALESLQSRLQGFLSRTMAEHRSQLSKLDLTNHQTSHTREEAISRLNDQLTAAKRNNQIIMKSFTSRLEHMEQQLTGKIHEMQRNEQTLLREIASQSERIEQLTAALKLERTKSQSEPAVFANRNQNSVMQPIPSKPQRQETTPPGKRKAPAINLVTQPLEARLSPRRYQPATVFDGASSSKSAVPSENKENCCSRTRRKKIFGEASTTMLHQRKDSITDRKPNTIEEIVSPIKRGTEDSHITETEHIWALDKLEDFHEENVMLDGSEEDVFFYPENKEQSDCELIVNDRSGMNALEVYQLLSKQQFRPASSNKPLSPSFYSPFEVGHRQ